MAFVTFPEAVEPRSELELLRRGLLKVEDEDQRRLFEEQIKSLRGYVFRKHDCWVLQHADFAVFVDDVLRKRGSECRIKLLRLLAHCATRRDFTALFASAERKKTLFEFFSDVFEGKIGGVEEEKASALLLCHVASHADGRNVLLYLSPWTMSAESSTTCNAEISLKAASASLSSLNPMLRSFGVGLAHNLSLKLDDEDKTCGEVLKQYFRLKRDFVSLLNNVLVKHRESGFLSAKDAELCEKAVVNFQTAPIHHVNGVT